METGKYKLFSRVKIPNIFSTWLQQGVAAWEFPFSISEVAHLTLAASTDSMWVKWLAISGFKLAMSHLSPHLKIII